MKTNKDIFKFDLQLFNDGGGSEEIPSANEPTPEPKTYTEEDLQKIADKRVTEAIKKREEKLRAEMQEQIEKERKEAEELAKLSEKEKADRLFAQQREEFEKQKLEFEKAKLELEATKILDERKIPTRFVKYVVADTAENTMANIESFEKEWKEALQAEIDARLKGKTPQKGDPMGTYNPWSKETFNLTEQGKIMQDNPALAQQLRAAARK